MIVEKIVIKNPIQPGDEFMCMRKSIINQQPRQEQRLFLMAIPQLHTFDVGVYLVEKTHRMPLQAVAFLFRN